MSFDDAQTLSPLLANQPLPQYAANNLNLFLRHLTEALRTNEAAGQMIVPNLSPGLRRQLADTCQVRIAEFSELIETIQEGYRAGFSTCALDEATELPKQMVVDLKRLSTLLISNVNVH
jgi:hypothetical protein